MKGLTKPVGRPATWVVRMLV